MPSTIGIIGAGNMGGAFYKGLVRVFQPESLLISDHDPKKLESLGVSKGVSLSELVSRADIVLLAVKPQSFTDLMKEAGAGLSQKWVISIMAGVSLKKLEEATGSKKIVRSMPNLPASAGQGFTAWVADKGVTLEEKQIVQKIFGAVGQESELSDERMLNPVTALSGSGPAYFFYLCELLRKKAEQWGFDPDTAQILARQTFIGSARLIETGDSAKDAAAWRAAVTSKGGTTEAAFKRLEQEGFEEVFFKGLEAAKGRAEELNNQF